MNQHVSTVTEVINRNIVVTLLLQHGYNVFLPVYDDGIDFIVHRRSDDRILKVQLKSRWTIDRKYKGRGIWVAFPYRGDWYLVPHETLMETAPAGVLNSRSWIDGGKYSNAAPSVSTMAALVSYRLEPKLELRRPPDLGPSGSEATPVEGRTVWQDLAEVRSRSLPVSLDEVLEFRDEGRR